MKNTARPPQESCVFDKGLYSDSGRHDATFFSAFANERCGLLSVYGGLVPLRFPHSNEPLPFDAYLEETGKLYCYSTYNGQPGGLTLIQVDPTCDTASGAVCEELYDAKGYEQYCITSPICGKDGTIYYKNDSGYILAVGSNYAYLTALTADAGTLKGEFKASTADLEWVVPVGTETVTFTPTACEGGTAETVTAILVDGTATAQITVTKGDDSRTYTVSIREISTDATLSELKVNESNAYSGKALAISPEFAPDVVYYTMLTAGDSRLFENVWPTAADANATVTVYPIRNVAVDTDTIEVTATNQKHDRYAVYFEDDTKAMAVRIVVTAENGDTKSYVLVLSKAAAAADGEALLAQIQAEDKLAADQEKAKPVMDLIDAIGTVSLSSADEIQAARDAYAALTQDQKALVANYETLTAAESTLAKQQAEAEKIAADKAAAQPVVEQIAALERNADAIRAARAAYDALTEEQKAFVTNYELLTAAEEALAKQQAEAEKAAKDKAAAECVMEQIAALGKNEEAIKAARAAYDALTEEQKALVTNYELLTKAEEALTRQEEPNPETGEAVGLVVATAFLLLAATAILLLPKKKWF